MDKVDIEKAQRLLDQGMRRGEVAIRMGVTYNVISGMIARKVLKDPDTRKRCYVEYKPMLQRRPITKQEIEEYREILKIPTTMAWDDITGKPNFLSVNSTDITLDNGNNQVTKNISSQMSGYKAVIPVLINTSSGNWNISVGIQGNILIAAGPGVISGYETVVRLYRFK